MNTCIGCGKPDILTKIVLLGTGSAIDGCMCSMCLWNCEMAWRAKLDEIQAAHAPPKRTEHDLDKYDGVPADTMNDRYAMMDYADENPRGFGGGER